MSDNPKSIPVPNDEYGFEDLCLRLYRKVLQLERLQNLGRRGQTQHGTDLIGNGIDGRTVCIQCKRREDKTLTAREIDRDINAILAKYPDVAHIRIATSQRRDSKLQHHVLVKEKALLPRCSLLIDSWQDIEQHLRDNADVLAWYVGPAPLPPELAQRLLAIEQGVLANSRLLISGQLIVASGASSIKPSLREALDEAQSGEPSRALGRLETLRSSVWEQLDEVAKYSLMSAIGNIQYLQENLSAAAQSFLTAREYSDTIEALCLEVRAFHYLSDSQRALLAINSLLDLHPTCVQAYALKLLVSHGPYNAELENVPEDYRRDPEVALALSFCAFESDSLPAALTHARDAHAAKPDWNVATAHLASMLLESVRADLEPCIDGAPRIRDATLVQEAEQLLTDVLDASGFISPASRGLAHYNRSTARKLLGKVDQGLADLEEAIRLCPDNGEMRANYGLTLLTRGNVDHGITQLERAIRDPNGNQTGTAMALASGLRRRGGHGDLPRAVKVLEHAQAAVTGATDEDRTEFVQELAKARFACSPDRYSAKDLPTSDLEGLLPRLTGRILRTFWLAKLGAHTAARQALEALIAERTKWTRVEKTWLAHACLELDEAAAVVELLHSESPAHGMTQHVAMLLDAALTVGDHAVVLPLVAELRAQGVAKSDLILAEAQILLQYGEYAKAEELLRAWLSTHGDDWRAWVCVGILGAHCRNAALVDECIDHLPNVANVPIADVGPLMATLVCASPERRQDAQRYLYELWRVHRTQQVAWFGMIHSVFFSRSQAFSNTRVPIATVGTTVTVRLGTGDFRQYAIRPNDAVDSPWGEVSHTGDIGRALLGSECGQTVLIPAYPHLKEGVVIDVRPSELATAALCLERWTTQFPESTHIFSLEVPHVDKATPAAMQEALSPVREMLEGQREAAGRLLREYSLRPVPVPLMARALSVSDGLMYQGLVEPPSPGLWYSADTAAEIQNGVGLLSTSSPIVLDLSAAMTVFRGGWERLLTDSVLVVSRTYDCLREYADEVFRRRSLVLEHHGSLVPHEVPPDELALTKRKIDNFVSDLLYRTRATSSIDLAGLTVAERRELELCVGKSAAAAVATAMRREGILWTDDLALRAHAVRLFPALKVISTTAIVEHACQRSSIKHSEAVEILAQLHIWGYRGAPVTSEVMTELLRRMAWNATSAPVVRCMDVVCEVDRLPKDVAHFLLHVLMCVWRARPLSPEPASVTAKLLGHLGKHPRRRECLDLLVRWSDAAFGLDVLAAVETQGVVQRLRKRNGW